VRARAWPAVGYAALFAAMALPWIRGAAHAVPFGNPFAFADDARFWVWQLGWTAHAMATDPFAILNANIHHPAPAELTSSEHLASTQLVAVPAIWLTGNPILVANAVVLASYPLAALAMRALLLALGCAAPAAWVGGLVFALGPLRVPGNLEVIHFLNVYLALAALALHRLRSRARAADVAWLFAALTAGMLSGYYMAAMLALTVAVWTAVELGDAVPGRARFLRRLGVAGGLASAVLIVVSLPYFGRPEIAALAAGQGVGGMRPFEWNAASLPGAMTMLRLLFGVAPLGLALAGLPALASPHAGARRAARAGLAVALAGLVVTFPPAWLVAAIEASPLRFLRAQFRFTAVAGLGTACLAAAALELTRSWLGARAGMVAAVVAGALVVATHGPALSGRADRLDADRPLHDAVAAATFDDRGPLLSLPLVDAHPELHGGFLPLGQLESDDMIGSLAHWLPLVGGHTGYEPLHRPVLLDVLRALPDTEALDELVDLTHVHWLLLRPPDYWREPAMVERLLALPGVSPVLVRDGWTLARIARPVRRPEWYGAIAAGYRPDRSVLGTPLEPLPNAAAVAVIEPVGAVPETAAPAGTITVTVRARNAGTRAWPVVVPPGRPTTSTVRLVALWDRLDASTPVPVSASALRRDVPAGDAIVQEARIRAPAEPGDYRLTVQVEQEQGARFDAPGNVALIAWMSIRTAPPARWSLVVPPVDPEPDPRKGWTTVGDHPSAAACEQDRIIRQRLASLDPYVGDPDPAQAARWRRARCIAAR
jgi:hypothetical protein